MTRERAGWPARVTRVRCGRCARRARAPEPAPRSSFAAFETACLWQPSYLGHTYTYFSSFVAYGSAGLPQGKSLGRCRAAWATGPPQGGGGVM